MYTIGAHRRFYRALLRSGTDLLHPEVSSRTSRSVTASARIDPCQLALTQASYEFVHVDVDVDADACTRSPTSKVRIRLSVCAARSPACRASVSVEG